MKTRKRKNRPNFCNYPAAEVLQRHINRGISTAEMSRLLNIPFPTLKSYLQRVGLPVKNTVKRFYGDATKIKRAAELVIAGYTEDEAMKMAMIETMSQHGESVINYNSFSILRHGHENLDPGFRYL